MDEQLDVATNGTEGTDQGSDQEQAGARESRPHVGTSAWYEMKRAEFEQKAADLEKKAWTELSSVETFRLAGLRAMIAQAADRAHIAAKLEGRGIDPADILVEYEQAVPREPLPPEMPGLDNVSEVPAATGESTTVEGRPPAEAQPV